MEATPTILNEDPKVFGIRIYDPAGSAANWSGQPVTVEARSGKSWGAKVGPLVRIEKDGTVGIYMDAKSEQKALDAGVVPLVAFPGDEAATDVQRAPVDDDGHLAELREALEDQILPARAIIKQALLALQLEADLSDDDFALALSTFDRLAGVKGDDAVPFDPRGDVTLFRWSPNQIARMSAEEAAAVLMFHRDNPPTMDYMTEFANSMAEMKLAEQRLDDLAVATEHNG